ncbi:ComEA family DNA-binding protein, partial [Nesterenkonia sp. F]|uniref:ComEA family DNA-binding protein n=1 Tax=Nesterenkonia sp. F TaxID=795955 RepID=UPI000255C8F9
PALRAEPGPGEGSGATTGGAEASSGASNMPDPGGEPEPPAGDSPSEDGTAAPVVVHVAGAVAEPGVVELVDGARVRDAVDAAGGLTDDAAAEGINLAAEAVDGGYLHVPTAEELESGEGAGPPAGPDGGAAPGGGATGDAGGEDGDAAPIDLNRADAQTLQRLTGIGPALADRIIEHRSETGPFASLEDLAGVKGIGPSTLEDVEDQVTW